jgi:SAM-dependent MidA family methyltransferase
MKETDIVTADEAAIEHSEHLQAVIRDEISSTGAMPFDRFMELALYAPGLGYYTAGSQKFGAAGDFVTAPEISALFSQCLANQCAEILQNTSGDILEFGAGSGIMAVHILLHLEKLDCLPLQYLILDLSPDLKQRQQQTIKNLAPHLLGKVTWVSQLPDSFNGVMLGNEVLDAMPVSMFQKQGDEIFEQFVVVERNEIKPQWQEASGLLHQRVQQLEKAYGKFSDGYTSEINFRLDGWIESLASCLNKGAIILIDYGYAGHEFYHADRKMGTLICHYQHRAHDDPFKLIGLQDVTANVDFSAVKQAAENNGLQVAGFAPQANFLVSAGIETLLSTYDPNDTETFISISQGVKALMLPSEMGERFKVIGLTKNIEATLSGFAMRDLSDRL